MEEGDLEATFECIKAYKEDGEELFAFFNSGEHSGASQRHRHIQFLPLESMRQGIDTSEQWLLLADQLLDEPRPGELQAPLLRFEEQCLTSAVLPFSYFSTAIPPSSSPRQLHEIYTLLYDQAVRRVRDITLKDGKVMPVLEQNESAISYNLALTNRVMVLCPRQSEGIKVTSVDGDEVGPVALNGTLLGGTLLVKSEAEWNALRNDESKLLDILQAIGVSPNISE